MSMDISRTIEADSTQVNAVDLTGSSRIVTITGVSKGPDSKQPVNLELAEFPGRSYRPCKSMRRVLVHAWGPDAQSYIGRRMRLYNDESVKWAGRAVGGIRINGLSDIAAGFQRTLQESQKSYVTYAIEKLPDQSNADRIAALRAEWKTADEERRQVIAAEVDALSGESE